MLDKKRTAIIFTANTPHVAHANLMLDSLLDEAKGNFSGDIWVISTGLSDRAKNYLDCRGVKYLVSTLSSVYEWKDWRRIAEAQPEYKELIKRNNKEDSLKLAFESYRNKRMSKLIILDWIEKFGENYDFVALGDNDLYFQKDIHELFDKAYTTSPDTLHYWQEESEITVGSWLWKKDFHYSRFYDVTNLDFGKHEINIGFILGKPVTLKQVFENVKKSFFTLNTELFIRHFWHDQDLVRLDRARYPERYTLVDEGAIVHLCASGDTVIEEKYPTEFVHRKTSEKPYIIHFAGGMWKKYPSIKDTYTVDPDWFYFSWETREEYDVIRESSLVNIFDTVNKGYFSDANEQSRIESRRRWMDISGNGKKNVVLMGWLEIATHKSSIDLLRDFILDKEMNLAILNGNVMKRKYEDFVAEDFPDILSALTRITKDAFLIRTFGNRITSVPEWILSDTIKALLTEYSCEERVGRAIANLLYIHFSEALDFYKPDVLLFWGCTSPLGKLMENLCKFKSIPFCGMEWGILPGTVSFDFNGHMAESWVAVKSQIFNQLEIKDEDVEAAREYLEVADDSNLSRNKANPVAEDVCEKIQALKKAGKKIILYLESNNAHSGNTYVDEEVAKIHSPLFCGDEEGYRALLKVCKEHEDWHILYKPHPISITRGIQSDIDYKCTTVVYEGGLNEVLELADLSVTILSQSAYISMIKRIPTLVLGKLQINDSGAVYTIDKESDLEVIIERAIEECITEEQWEAFEKHVARVLKYYVFSIDDMVPARKVSEMADSFLSIVEGTNEYFYESEREAYVAQCKDRDNVAETNPLVSVVIPVHNSEEYLAECLSSICNQSLKSLEIICVNNGSTDYSQKMLEYYAKRDGRIKIIEQEEFPNASSPRNNGIKNAIGKYIYLMDSDDFVDSTALEELVDIAEQKESDLVYFFFREVKSKIERVYGRPRFYSYRRFFPEDKVFKLEEEYYRYFIQYPFPWAKLMRRDFVIENEIYFDLDCRCFEDNPHNLKALLSAKNPYVYNKQLYNLRIHGKSTTQSVNPSIVGMIDAIRIMNSIYEEKGKYTDYQKWYVPYKIHVLGWAWNFLPEEDREYYHNEVSNLFTQSDKRWFENDEVWSYYEMPDARNVKRVRHMLNEKYQPTPIVQITEDIVENKEPEPWELISKPHLYAIKVCEKLHIIKLAIRIKALIIPKNKK